MHSRFLVLSILIVTLYADTYVYEDCVPCTSKPGCNECLVYSGGPFNNQNNSVIGKCVNKSGGCSNRNYTNTVFSFSCGGCAFEGQCSYKIEGYFLKNISVWTGCSNSSDNIWNQAKSYLDSVYQNLYGNVTHTWCDSVCEILTPGQQALVIIGSFGVVSIALAIFSHLSCSKKSQSSLL